MAEGKFLNFPGKRESKAFVRKKGGLSEKKFENLVSTWERRVVEGKDQRIHGLVDKYEVQKSPQQKAILNFVLEGAQETLEKYGAEADQLDLENIHLLKEGFWSERDIENLDGANFSLSNEIGIRSKEEQTNSQLANTAFHELMHHYSFVRVALEKGRDDGYPSFQPERVALATRNSKTGDFFLQKLNEAITSELTHRFMQKNKQHPFFKEDFWKIKKHLSYSSEKRSSSLIEKETEEGERKYLWDREYLEEVNNMHAMFDDVLEKNPEQFSSQEEVFDFFARAYFKGDLMGISRLLKKTYNNRPIKEIIAEKGL